MKLRILALSLALAWGSAQAQNTESLQLPNLVQGTVSLAHSKGYTGRGSVIGVIDQGFDLKHPDLAGRVIASMNMLAGPVTSGTHGTAMASIAAGSKNGIGTIGVAPEASLLLAQAGLGGTNLAMDQRAVKIGLDWLSSRQATVINMSFGSSFDSTFIRTVRSQPGKAVYIGPSVANNIADFKTATDRGSILVFAAGNQGLPFSQYPGIYAVQTTAQGQLVLGGRAIVVGAVDANNTISSYSNRAGHLCLNAVGSSCKDTVLLRQYFVVAPGDRQLAATPGSGVAYMSGTSGAAAYVSGSVALLRQAWPQLKPEQIVQVLLNNTRDLGAPGIDDVYGRGLIDIERATRTQGTLLVGAQNYQVGSGAPTGLALNTTSVGGGIAQSLRGTSIGQTQVIDELGRHYQADLTRATVKMGLTYDALSPYLAASGYRPAAFNFGDTDVTVLAGNQGSAIQLSRQWMGLDVAYQFGSVQEANGFAGNYGTGALDLGSSSTAWNMFTVESAVTQRMTIVASYAQGFTRVIANPMSMVAITGPVKTDTWQIGLRQKSIFLERDQLGFGIAGDVRIRSGQAQVTTVTGYDFYENAQGDVQGRPIVSREQVDLAQRTQPIAWANYRLMTSNTSYLVGGMAVGNAGYRIGVNFTWLQ